MMRMFGKLVRINLPDLGEGTKDATIKEWFVKEGQKIKEVSSCLLLYSDLSLSMTTYARCSPTSWSQRFHPRMTVWSRVSNTRMMKCALSVMLSSRSRLKMAVMLLFPLNKLQRKLNSPLPLHLLMRASKLEERSSMQRLRNQIARLWLHLLFVALLKNMVSTFLRYRLPARMEEY